MATAETVKAQLQADIAAANEVTGKDDATMHDAVASLIEGFGGGEKIFTAPSGAMYTAIYTNARRDAEPSNVYRLSANLFCDAKHIEEVTLYGWPNVVSSRNNNPVGGNPLLRKLHLPDFKANGFSYTYNNTYIVEHVCPELVDITLGKIGTPVESTIYNMAFRGATNTNLVITVYVDCDTLADAQALHSDAPWGATNATIVYRNSTTGEVITE